MKPRLMEILACPVCKGKLDLTVSEKKDEEIVTGSLFCPKCGVRYPIQNCIPNLLPPKKEP
ncbi:MAG: methytransferase partner Trm112 [Chloroflexota bacterium]